FLCGLCFFFQAEDGIRDFHVTGVQTCALPIYKDTGLKVIIEDGVAKLPDRTSFAGSVATADRLVRNMVQLVGVTLIEAVQMMTTTPARIMGIQDSKGSITVGKDADLVIFDEGINIITTLTNGNVI